MNQNLHNLIKSKLLTRRIHEAIEKFQSEMAENEIAGIDGQAKVLISFDNETIEWAWETKDNQILRSYEKGIGNYD